VFFTFFFKSNVDLTRRELDSTRQKGYKFQFQQPSRGILEKTNANGKSRNARVLMNRHASCSYNYTCNIDHFCIANYDCKRGFFYHSYDLFIKKHFAAKRCFCAEKLHFHKIPWRTLRILSFIFEFSKSKFIKIDRFHVSLTDKFCP